MTRSTVNSRTGSTRIDRFRSNRGAVGWLYHGSFARPVLEAQKRASRHEKDSQRAGYVQSLRVCSNAAVTHPSEAGDYLQHQYRERDRCPHPRLPSVLAPLNRIESGNQTIAAVRLSPVPPRERAHQLALTLRQRVAPDGCINTVHQFGQRMGSWALAVVAATEWSSRC
jgi:hypothetical protein